jgi:hypothetical protein
MLLLLLLPTCRLVVVLLGQGDVSHGIINLTIWQCCPRCSSDCSSAHRAVPMPCGAQFVRLLVFLFVCLFVLVGWSMYQLGGWAAGCVSV